jgi:plasmid stabilization system protein ParE
MERYRLIITPRAGADIAEICDYIEHDSPQNAVVAARRILDAMEGLERFPHRTVMPRQSKKLKHPVRTLPVPPWVIYFRVLEDERVVRVLHVRHGARRRPRKFDF